MAKQIEGVSERILTCAKQEFLDKGYTEASLRTIAAAAGTSTNSIYVRFHDKEGLFSAIVEPVINGMTERFLQIQEQFHQMEHTEQAAHMEECADGGTMELVNYMYDHLDEFRLLLDASAGTRFCGRSGAHRGGVHLQIYGNHRLYWRTWQRHHRNASPHCDHLPV